MTINIDWNFIATLEGEKLTGYVPDPQISHSGVTIASGCDLGQMTHDEIIAAWPGSLGQRLSVYAGLHGTVAQEALKVHPLTVTVAEAVAINQFTHQTTIRELDLHYRASSGNPLEVIPPAAQTILASLTFQYGSPWVRCPKTWYAAMHGDWADVIHDLEHFGDAYQTRHSAEAKYLAEHLPG